MRPLVCILSVGMMSEVIMEQVRQMELPADFILHEPSSNDEGIPPSLKNVDVFLSSGYQAKRITEKTSKPVISIKINTYDILVALSNAIQYDEKPVIIIYENDYSKLNQIRNILSASPIQDSYNKPESLEQIILKHKRSGRRAIIGSGLACSLAEKHGLIHTFVFSQESIRNYIQMAAELAASIHTKMRNLRQMSSVINYVNRGLVFTDGNGVISVCNPVAATIFQIDGNQAVGSNILDLFSGGELDHIFEIKETEVNILVLVNGKEYLFSAIPILHSEELVNMLFFIDDVSSIQKADRHIRENLINKGFSARYHFHHYMSRSRDFQQFVETAKKFSKTDESIVIYGETGTGKEVLAQSIHNYSDRSDNAFVAVNCSAISTNLLESELFGYDEGAFTGARKGGKKGLFEMAHLGTIFLDEIGDMDLSLQAKLLRVIQEKEVMHVGGTKMILFDTRVIAASNRNLWELVEQKKFREDLYYRLNVLELNIMPLRERTVDIYPLFNSFLVETAPQIISLLNPYASDIETLLSSYPWPGNVRELKNFTKMLIASLDSQYNAKEIFNLMAEILNNKLRRQNQTISIEEPAAQKVKDILSKDGESEIQEILSALENTKGNQSEAAKLLGISRVTLWRKIKQMEN